MATPVSTVKALDPHHLYMGFWIVINWWENEEDWRIMSRYVDVVGIDRYATNYDDAQVQLLFGLVRVPSEPPRVGARRHAPNGPVRTR
ncbi:hypothetical protein JQX13_26360 [Archangium violaceum]|uniref:hypothetical protein n=1 Tax=Archangium violaceum TaxID=83451 RepID=UPI00193C54D4|nr:hypothetical protein [Archangium violaceum]QRK13243.1 hypothetical protein JQX13_26360 [Archangium violaceum]